MHSGRAGGFVDPWDWCQGEARLRLRRQDDVQESRLHLRHARHAISQETGGALLGEMLDAWMFGGGLGELLEHDNRVRAADGLTKRH